MVAFFIVLREFRRQYCFFSQGRTARLLTQVSIYPMVRTRVFKILCQLTKSWY